MSTQAGRRRATTVEKNARIFAPIKAHRTFETVIERIIEAIDSQGLSEGDRLPNESEMARLLEVSRPTLRQALRVLETSGVLKIRAGQAGGVFVASEMVPVEVLGQNIALEVHHVGELIATRRIIEPIVYHLAAENASEEELDRIADAIELMRRHLGEPNMISRADGLYHRRIAHAAGNQILLRTMTGIYRDLNPLRGALSNDREHGLHMIDVHSRQLEAIRARDHEGLERMLQETFVDLEEEFKVTSRFSVRWTPREDNVSAKAPPERKRRARA
ncbi:MAG: FadR family transcriptional regulator [Devosia sp.]|uniref:FadR/GntR family transcriptional regulator n=1 Tax=Devosia sp. TaxID=1871048 RepID=UPI001A6423E3|nr:FCD domain-containing protein [Devosia sp.]MBL8600015.1 FadR family transcriptional regulator [Devosia sp.]